MLQTVLALMLVVLSGGVTSAAGLSSRDFLEGCRTVARGSEPAAMNRTQEFATIFCAAYVSGLMEGLGINEFYPSRICLPVGIAREEAFRAIVKQMRMDAPSHGHGEITVAAAARAFPCR